MKSEQSLMEIFSRIHGTRPFGADAEVVPFEGTNLLVSTDSFSDREDFLSALEPEAMGRVMAYAAIADITAYGGKVGRMVSPPPDYRAIPREGWLAETAAYWTSLWA